MEISATNHTHLMLMIRHAMYYGRASEAVDWFSKMGYQLPYGINTADFILDLASADVSTALLCAKP